MDASFIEAGKANRPVRAVKLLQGGGKKVRDITAGPGIAQGTHLDLGSSFGVVPKSSTQQMSQTLHSPYSVKPLVLGPIRQIRPPRLKQTLEETYQAKSLSFRDAPSSSASPPASPKNKGLSPRGHPSPGGPTPRGLAMMGVTLSEAMLAREPIMRDDKLREAYNEAAHQRGVLSKNRRQLIKDIGDDNRVKARLLRKRTEAERKQHRLNCEDEEKLKAAVRSAVPREIWKDSKMFGQSKSKSMATKRFSIGAVTGIMLAMVHEEEDANSDEDEEVDLQDREACSARPSMTKRASILKDAASLQNADEASGSRRGSKASCQSPSKQRITLVAPKDGMVAPGELALKLHKPKAERMEKLGSLADNEIRSKKLHRLLHARTKQFQALPPVEREALKHAFEKHDKDNGQTLDNHELKAALGELGLKPQRDLEKKEIAMIVQECIVVGDVDFFNFCFDLVPRVRKRLREMREGPMLEMFNKYDQDGSGLLDREECREIFRVVCGTNLDIQSGLKLMESFEELHSEVCMENSDEVDFKGFLKLISELEEAAGRLRSERELYIKNNYDIPKQLLSKHQDRMKPNKTKQKQKNNRNIAQPNQKNDTTRKTTPKKKDI
eukprot:gnl/MRDRNA2_/MRDRNA2_76124_c0_seq2.p1 gnl/MRDRNA2_/MRDRNA2_76124_c0~~gnl/MRDRNA2_/MRDRNA2_76124_c0_seq2.p1  ORF type:complete len:610 (-),score=129.59 gnl/MRDRNA2_/MRDRNA2_76124_c0_seq2:17-1846(-)